MNPIVIKESLQTHIGQTVKVKINGMRNKTDSFIGVLKDIYPQIFTIEVEGNIKSFSYSELINKEVILTFI